MVEALRGLPFPSATLRRIPFALNPILHDGPKRLPLQGGRTVCTTSNPPLRHSCCVTMSANCGRKRIRKKSWILCARYTLFGKPFSLSLPIGVRRRRDQTGPESHGRDEPISKRHILFSVIVGLKHLGERLYFHYQESKEGDAVGLQDTKRWRSWVSFASIPLGLESG